MVQAAAGAIGGSVQLPFFKDQGAPVLVKDSGILAKLNAATGRVEELRQHPAWQRFLDGDDGATRELMAEIGLTDEDVAHARELGFDVDAAIAIIRQASRDGRLLHYGAVPYEGEEATLVEDGDLIVVGVPVLSQEQAEALRDAPGMW